MSGSKIIYDGKLTKLEVFNKNHKLYTSLPIHKKALGAGLVLPKIYNIENKNGIIYKYTEWVNGNTIQQEMDKNPDLIENICNDLARYVNKLYDVDNITAVDSHFENFVWHRNHVVYIDLKKLLYRNSDEHILQMSKICLKGCRGDRSKSVSFLKGYNKYRDVKPVVLDCDNRNWRWQNMNGGFVEIKPIKIGDVT